MKQRTETKRIKTTSLMMLLLIVLGSFQLNAKEISLRVGDQPPPINATKWVKGEPVTELQKGKVYVVEFGATWCSGCKAIIPRLTSLSRKYRGKAEVISVFVMGFVRGKTIEEQEVDHFKSVEKYVAEKSNRMRYKVAVDNAEQVVKNAWHNAAGLSGIPSVFLIDKQGRIAYIGRYTSEFEALVDDVVNDRHSMEELIQKAREAEAKIIPYDRTKPMLIDGNGGADTSFVFRSLLVKYKEGLKAGRSEFMYGKRRMLQEAGVDLSFLYHLAYGDTITNRPNYKNNTYGKSWPEIILEVSDKSPFEFDYKKPENRWNYSLIVPEKKSAGALQEIMQRDLKNYFGYTVSVENRDMPCWILTATKKAKKKLAAKTPGNKFKQTPNELIGFTFTNASINNLIIMLRRSNYKEPPFIDETGIEGEIDIELNVNIRNFEDLTEALEENGLMLKKGKRKMKVVVIRDPKK